MEYSVDRVIQLLKDKGLTVRPGTVINYRAKLSSFGIIENNQSLTDVHIATLERIVASKTDEKSWERLMSQFIYQDFSSQIKVEFEWGMKTVTKHLIWAIQNKKYKSSFEIRYLKSDNTYIWLKINLVSLFDSEGIVKRIIGFANDISAFMITGVAGGALIPPVMGMIADVSNQSTSLFVLILILVYLFIASLKLKKN